MKKRIIQSAYLVNTKTGFARKVLVDGNHYYYRGSGGWRSIACLPKMMEIQVVGEPLPEKNWMDSRWLD